MPRKKSAAPSTKRPRASWQGNLSFGLVSFAVEAINALDRQQSDIHFHQLHASCHQRIRYVKTCPKHGEVSQDEIVSGYEVSRGNYIEFDPDELDALRTEEERALTIEAFVDPTTIDPVYYDGRMYYLVPQGKSAETPYSVIVAAMEKQQTQAVGHIVFSGKEQIVLLRALEGLLQMAMLNYDAEIRAPSVFSDFVSKPAGQARQIKLAQTLIGEYYVDNFDFSQYTDKYRDKVLELIDAKSKGKKLVQPTQAERPATINLMEALKKSLGQQEKPAPKKTTRRKAKSA